MAVTLDPVSPPGAGTTEREYLEYVAQWLDQARRKILGAIVTGNAITGVDISGTVPDLLQVDGLKGLALPSPVASEFFQVNAGATAFQSVGFGTGSGDICEGDDARLSDTRDPNAHGSSHEDAGSDEIDVTGLSGLLADAQTPLAHSTMHETGGSGEVNLNGLYWSAGGSTRIRGIWAQETLSGLSGASVSTTGLVPAGALAVKIVAEVTTDITGATTWDAGDGSDTDLFGAGLALSAGTTLDPTDYTLPIGEYDYVSAGLDVTLTANGLNFSAGEVVVSAFYFIMTV